MLDVLATAERAASLADRVWAVFVLVLTLVTAGLVAALAVSTLAFGAPPPGLARARPYILSLALVTLGVLFVAYVVR